MDWLFGLGYFGLFLGSFLAATVVPFSADVLLFGMQILDFFDFLTNSIMMPIAALATCFLILKVVGFKRIADEVQISSVFHRRKVYEFFMKYLAPVCILVILLSSIANVLGLITM